ncbi:polyamine deacetylase HDAC10 isoform X2 [Leucoraja erinacea]|uniref:polyamine deacetylase HDAC10 isoform X2 n=1 Tax=Leucoraja erinaceus TaxID=7782 RepID=UPI0024569B6F|nr:polyamine deacetylase HDAC10 isoform X2 [Leucoraja erinacea]
MERADPELPAPSAATMASGTGLIYSEQMMSHQLLWDFPACSIEIPERLSAPFDKLKQYGLVERCIQLPVREAIEEEIILVHSLEYLKAVKSTASMNVEELKSFSYKYDDVYFHPNSYHCATLSVGATLQLVDAVMSGRVRNGMALVRPPGHHSQKNDACGYCIFNNVAIAAKYAKQRHGTKRILIVDWDVHHGQGTQYIFEKDSSVLYFSWHRYEHQQFWPNLKDSDYDAIGKGNGAGFTINLPWNKVGMGNADYLAAFLSILLPMAYEFNPELILVSAGFDSVVGDPEGEMCATPECFAHLTQLLMPLANGKLCVVLEGGYNLRSLSESVCMTIRALLGDPVPPLVGQMAPCISAVETIQNVTAVHQPYWKCLKYHEGIIIKDPRLKKLNCCTEEHNFESNITTTEKEITMLSKEKQDFDEFMDSHMKKVLVLTPSVRTAWAGDEVKSAKLDKCLKVEAKKTFSSAGILLSAGDTAELENKIILPSLGYIFPLIDKIAKREVRNGIVVAPSLSSSVVAAQYSITVGLSRVLLLVLGDAEIPDDVKADEKILVVNICGKQKEKGRNNYFIPICWKEGNECDGDLLHATFELILPVAYEHRPELVIFALGDNTGIQAVTLAHLTHLLQLLAEGRILVMTQASDLVATLTSSLLGDPLPSIRSFVLNQENAFVLMKLTQELNQHWKLLPKSVH